MTEVKSLSVLLKELQELFNAHIRHRDKGLGCIYCGEQCRGNSLHWPTAAHYLPVSTAGGLRFDTDNVHLGGASCNDKDDRVAYRANLVAKIGLERVELLEARQHTLYKMTKFEVMEKIALFKKLNRGLTF